MRPNNFLLLDYGPITLSKDLLQVDFNDITEFEFYAGTSAADLVRGYENDYLYYDVETPNFTDTKRPELNWENTGVNANYDGLIDMAPVLRERKDDSYYGLDDAAQLEFARSKIVREIYTMLRYTDAGMMSDARISAEARERLITYRDGLRDLASLAKSLTVNEVSMVKSMVIPQIPDEFTFDKCL